MKMRLSDDARQAIHDQRWGPHIDNPIERQEADDEVIKKVMAAFDQLEAENEKLDKENAIYSLNTRFMEEENAELKKTAGELAIQLWHATPPVTTVGEDETWIWPAKTGG